MNSLLFQFYNDFSLQRYSLLVQVSQANMQTETKQFYAKWTTFSFPQLTHFAIYMSLILFFWLHNSYSKYISIYSVNESYMYFWCDSHLKLDSVSVLLPSATLWPSFGIILFKFIFSCFPFYILSYLIHIYIYIQVLLISTLHYGG